MIYDLDESRLDLISDDEGISSAPYINSYHNLDMNFQKLGWNLDSDEIIFGVYQILLLNQLFLNQIAFTENQNLIDC